jgi:hypothetical protein
VNFYPVYRSHHIVGRAEPRQEQVMTGLEPDVVVFAEFKAYIATVFEFHYDEAFLQVFLLLDSIQRLSVLGFESESRRKSVFVC